MKKSSRILAVAAVICLILSIGSYGLAADDDWADYQQYVISFAIAGAPTEADAEEFTNTILGCPDMDSLLAGTGMGVIFDVMGALSFSDWTAAGKPTADTNDITPDVDATDMEDDMPADVTLIVYNENGQLYIKGADLLALLLS